MSPPVVTPAFRRLATATAVLIYLLAVVGGVVRVTGSGLGCPDWPLCHGRLLPPLEITAIIEYTHRSVAALGGLFILLTTALAWLRYRWLGRITVPTAAIVVLLAVQVPLGAVVVATELEPLAVAFHLGMALIILALALFTAVACYPVESSGLPRGYVTLLGSVVVALFVLLISGALVVGSNASFACPDWPLCRGGLLPPAGASPLIAIHILHRYTVAAVAVLMGAVVVQTFRQAGGLVGARTWAVVLGVLFVAQVSIGAIQVWLLKPPLLKAVHLAIGSAVWSALIVLAALAALGAWWVEGADRV